MLMLLSPKKSNILSSAVTVVVFVINAWLLIQTRKRQSIAGVVVLALWLACHFSLYRQDAALTRVLTLLFFSVLCMLIEWHVLTVNRKIFRENTVLFRSRDVVLTMLNDISSSASDIASVDNALRSVLTTIVETVEVEGAALYTPKQGEEGVTVLGHQQSTGLFWPMKAGLELLITKQQFVKDALEQETFETGRGVPGYVADRGEALNLNLKKEYDRMASLALNTKNIRSIMAAPVRVKDRLYGVLVAQNKKPEDSFSDADFQIFNALAAQAGISIGNIGMYRDLARTDRLRQEASIATQIQNQLLPKNVPEFQNLRITSFIKPAKEVGGDYYDFIAHGDGTPGIVIGDVSGKGVPAGMMMAVARTVLHIVAKERRDPRDVVCTFSREMYGNMQKGQFMTLNFLRWDGQGRTLTFAGAGHEHILWFHRKDGRSEKIKAGGVAAGLVDDPETYVNSGRIEAAQGDVFVLYTDGVTEARNAAGEMFTLRRLQNSLDSYAFLLDPAKVSGQLLKDVFDFTGQTDQYDDITMLVMSVTG